MSAAAPADDRIVATVRLPISLKRLNRLAHMMVREYGHSVRMYQQGDFMALYVPEDDADA